MFLIISDFIFIATFLVTILSNWKANKNKRLLEIAPISIILQVGAFFDIMILVFQDPNSSRLLDIFYWVAFQFTILFADKIPKTWSIIVTPVLLLLSLTLIRVFDYSFLKNDLIYFVYPLILLQICSILFTAYNSLNHKRKLTAINYFYYLLLGFLMLDLMFFLGYYHIIKFDFSIWMIFLKFYAFYLNILRVIYILYVAKNF